MSSLPQLAQPAWLWLLLLLPLLLWRHHRGHRLAPLRYSRLPEHAGGAWRCHLPFYCRWLALGLLILALGRPQWVNSWQETRIEGIDIQLVLDVSGSMAAEDFQPRNRLEVAKDVVSTFIAQRPADRVGLVLFAGSALTRSPLTTDRAMLRRLVERIELGTLPDGTAIGVALATAAARLRSSDAASRVAVLVTDGANNGGEIDPRSATALCRSLGIRVYTVGVGTGGRVPVPRTVIDRNTGHRTIERVYARMEVDNDLLKAVAEGTGGQFYQATDPQTLRRIFEEIDHLETSERTVEHFQSYQETFQPLAALALGLLLLPLLTTAGGLTVEP